MRSLLLLLLSAGFVLAQKPTPPRLPPRPARTEAEYKEWATELRTLYSQPAVKWPKPNIDEGVEFVELGLIPPVSHPKSNPYSKEKAELGKSLFFDPRLSGSGQIACASCHDPDLSWTDGRATSFGHGRIPLKRNAPTVLNSGHLKVLFWDGRAESLEDQAKQVLANPSEMRSDEKEIIRRLSEVKGYAELFELAFGDRSMNLDRMAEAIACFERTLIGGRSRFDQFLKGNAKVLTDSELRGLHLFRTDARCVNCHHGPLLTDGRFHDVGLSYFGRAFEDLGRYAITKQNTDVGRFRTPSLRNVGRTAPYMHNGLFELDEVLRLYNAGMPTLRRSEKTQDDPRFPTKSPHLKPLGLNPHDLMDLAAFLRSLDELPRRIRPPALSLPAGVLDAGRERAEMP